MADTPEDDDLPEGFIKLFGDPAAMQAEMDGDESHALSALKEEWQGLETRDPEPQDLKNILISAAARINGIKDTNIRQTARNYITENFNLWESKFIAKLDQFNMEDIALCLWAYNDFDRRPVDASIEKLIARVSPPEILKREETKKDCRIVKAFYFYAINELRPDRPFMDRWEAAIHEDMKKATNNPKKNLHKPVKQHYLVLRKASHRTPASYHGAMAKLAGTKNK